VGERIDRPAAKNEAWGVMTLQERIAAMQERIVKAESERDRWRASGMQEKYLEAYSMVEALGLQLDLLQKAVRLSAAGTRHGDHA
jgi:uncharacterized small protein (DUF1192 family)